MSIFGAVWLSSSWRPNACVILLLFAQVFSWPPSPAWLFSSAVELVRIWLRARPLFSRREQDDAHSLLFLPSRRQCLRQRYRQDPSSCRLRLQQPLRRFLSVWVGCRCFLLRLDCPA